MLLFSLEEALKKINGVNLFFNRKVKSFHSFFFLMWKFASNKKNSCWIEKYFFFLLNWERENGKTLLYENKKALRGQKCKSLTRLSKKEREILIWKATWATLNLLLVNLVGIYLAFSWAWVWKWNIKFSQNNWVEDVYWLNEMEFGWKFVVQTKKNGKIEKMGWWGWI